MPLTHQLHMTLAHHFDVHNDVHWLPLQGLKLQYGHVPLYVRGDDTKSKQFTTLHGVQRHMVDANKCKMVFDDNEEEYVEFYDWSKLEDELAGTATACWCYADSYAWSVQSISNMSACGEHCIACLHCKSCAATVLVPDAWPSALCAMVWCKE